MDWNLILASAHHLAVFTLVMLFAAEFTLLRTGLSGARIGQLARIDAAYGGVAGLVIVIGILRVIFGGVDPMYYLGNHAFWGKMGAFAIMGLLTIQPTIAIRRWVKAGEGVLEFAPPAGEIAASRRFIHLQAGVLLLIPIFAAAMARGYGS
ncbi:putative membrane protein [Devosia crocina]|uniref:Putative membrane protein n=2 Tax=Devosia crocina TaxID=429728 RepID=A0A1I7NSU3_9HYPH|nr:putative membrane protein [Devosia crocina]